MHEDDGQNHLFAFKNRDGERGRGRAAGQMLIFWLVTGVFQSFLWVRWFRHLECYQTSRISPAHHLNLYQTPLACRYTRPNPEKSLFGAVVQVEHRWYQCLYCLLLATFASLSAASVPQNILESPVRSFDLSL